MTGSIKTQTRPSQSNPVIVTRRGPGYAIVNNVSSPIDSVQTTTSFRSSGAEASDSELIREFTTVFRNSRKSNPLWDNGHPFSTVKESWSTSHPDWNITLPSSQWMYQGPLILNPSGSLTLRSSFGAASALSQTELRSFGARAIQATAPTRPQANLFTAVGELTNDGLPRLIGHSVDFAARANHFRSLGSEYLNVTFGWIPFVKDITAVVHSLRNASETILQLERDSDRWVRRGFRIPITNELVASSAYTNSIARALYAINGTSGAEDAYLAGKVSETTQHTTRYREMWFKGCYTYMFQAGLTRLDKIRHFLELSDKLVGSSLTPEALWNLAPWSWLVDWYGNIGNILSNASLLSSDSLVLRYGYVMCTTRDTTVRTNPHIRFVTGGPGVVTNTFTRTRKERVQSGPYGFAFTAADLTPKQWAILAALGLSKSPRTLKSSWV